MRITDLSEEQIARAAANGIKRNNLSMRLVKGWDVERALTQPETTTIQQKARKGAKASPWRQGIPGRNRHV